MSGHLEDSIGRGIVREFAIEFVCELKTNLAIFGRESKIDLAPNWQFSAANPSKIDLAPNWPFSSVNRPVNRRLTWHPFGHDFGHELRTVFTVNSSGNQR